jgi:hypothetical protein
MFIFRRRDSLSLQHDQLTTLFRTAFPVQGSVKSIVNMVASKKSVGAWVLCSLFCFSKNILKFLKILKNT